LFWSLNSLPSLSVSSSGVSSRVMSAATGIS
jgi:hypothetical protein